MAVVEQNLGADREEAIILTSRAVGFRATSTQLREMIEQQIDFLISLDVLTEVDGRLTRSVHRSD